MVGGSSEKGASRVPAVGLEREITGRPMCAARKLLACRSPEQ